MKYWIKIGLTMAMIVVISALSSTVTPAQDKTFNKLEKPINNTSSPEQDSTTHASNSYRSCRKPVINGIECPENKKCPVNDSCDDYSQCPCMDGYTAYDATEGAIRRIGCQDIHECLDKKHNCGQNTGCKNSDGGYYCACNEGFVKGNVTEFCPTDNRTENGCTDIDECGGPDICNILPNTVCINTVGSFKCVCKSGFLNISNQCNVSCNDKIPPACNKTKLQCVLDTFTESWKPMCNDSIREKFNVDTFLDNLDKLIFTFTNKSKEERLKMSGKLLNAVERMVQNLDYLFPKPMSPTKKQNFINTVRISRTSEDRKISLRNRNSTIHLDTKTALGKATNTPVVGCLEYGNIAPLLEGAELKIGSQDLTAKLVSSVVSVFFGMDNTSNLSKPIQLQLNFTEKNVTSSKTHCAFWSVEDAAWSTEGCETLERHQHGVVCNCTHLTSFAILMAMGNIESWTLTLLTKIGLSISIVCLAVAIITFSLCRFLRGKRNTIHIHLCVSLLLGHCIFLIGIEAFSNKVVCGIVAGLLHFFYLSAFCWMSLEGLELYLMLVNVFKTQVKTRYLLAVGYGVPTVIIIISAAVFPGGYGTKKHCWLSTDHNFIWSFMGPVCVIILMNCGIFVLTVWKLAEKMTAINPEQGKLKRLRSLTVTSVAQLCILGCCWAFGFLMFGKADIVFAYAFTICNVLQGVQIFFLHCLMNKKVRDKYSDVICALAHFRSPLYSEFSNSSNVNTQSRAKVSKESGL